MGNAAKSVRYRRCPYCGTAWQVNATGLMEHVLVCRLNPKPVKPTRWWHKVWNVWAQLRGYGKER